VALVEGGEWQAPPGLETHPMFRGYAVFLLGRERRWGEVRFRTRRSSG